MRTAKASSFFDGWKPKEGISHKAPYDCLWMGLFMLLTCMIYQLITIVRSSKRGF